MSKLNTKDGEKMVVAQATVPRDIFENVRSRAETEYVHMASFFRRWIVRGYNEDKRNGLI